MNIVWNDRLLAEDVDPMLVGAFVEALRSVAPSSAKPIQVAVHEYKGSKKHPAYYAVMKLIQQTGSAVEYDALGRYRATGKPKERAELSLTYTTEPPKVDGLYHMKWPGCPASIRYICIRDVEDWEALKGVLFAGPIPEPTEPKEQP